MKTLLVAVSVLVLLVPAFSKDARADELEKKSTAVDFRVVLKDFDGTALTYPECGKPDPQNPRECAKGALAFKDMTAAYVAVSALAMPEQNEDVVEQIRRSLLAEDIVKRGAVQLSGKDLELLDRVIPKWVAARQLKTVVTLRALELIDPAFIEKTHQQNP